MRLWVAKADRAYPSVDLDPLKTRRKTQRHDTFVPRNDRFVP